MRRLIPFVVAVVFAACAAGDDANTADTGAAAGTGVPATAQPGTGVSDTTRQDTGRASTDTGRTSADTGRQAGTAANQTQSGVTNARTGASTLGPGVRRLEPTQGQRTVNREPGTPPPRPPR